VIRHLLGSQEIRLGCVKEKGWTIKSENIVSQYGELLPMAAGLWE
jgi:hypothetical protein